MTAELLIASLQLSIPEIILAVGAMALLMIGVFVGEKSTTMVTGLAVALLIISGLWLVLITGEGVAYGGAFLSDPFAKFMKVLVLIGSVTAMVMAVGQPRAERIDRFEFPVLIVLATLGMLLMVSANDLMSLYVGLELQSLALYVVAAINRDSVRSTEAGLWLHRPYRLHRDRCCADRDRALAGAGLRCRVRARRPCFQDLRRALSYVDARCL
jgi:NADH-quinone oxidoreductase subunit N